MEVDDAIGSQQQQQQQQSETAAVRNEPKKFKKLKKIWSKLQLYCDQLIVLGFNSQKYDIPMIKNYLPSSLTRRDDMPRFVVKKGGGYMVIASTKLKYNISREII